MKRFFKAKSDSSVPRRGFLKISLSGIIAGTLFRQSVRADENELNEIAKKAIEAAAEKIKENLPAALKPPPFMLKELAVDHDQAKKEYAKLLELIPTQERYRPPQPLKGRNAYFELLKIEKLYVSEFEFGKSDTFAEKFDDGLLTPTPWPDDAFYHGPVKDFLKRNEKFYLAMIDEIKKGDYYSIDDTTEPRYRTTDNLDDSVGNVSILRTIAYSFRHLTLALVREEKWSEAYELLDLWTRLYALVQKGKMFLVNFLVLKACWSIFCESIASLCGNPLVTDEWLVKYAELLKKEPDLRALFKAAVMVEFQEWMLSNIATLPELENPKFQYLATRTLVHPDSKLPARKDRSKLLKILTPEAVSEQHKGELEFSEKIETIFNNKQKLFDRAKTVEESWKIIKSVVKFVETERELDRKTFWKAPDEYRSLNLIRYRGAFESMFSLRNENEEAEESKSDALKKVAKVENPLGKFLIIKNLSFCTNLSRIFRPTILELHQSIQIRIALKLYERKHKERPTTLAALEKEKFLKRVPKNPFTNEGWGYDATREIIWRTGKEGTAEGMVESIENEKKLPPGERRKEHEIVEEEKENGIFRLYEVIDS